MTTPRTKTTVTKTAIPAGAKMPADREPKDDGKLRVPWNGKQWIVDKSAFDDMDFLEAAENTMYVRCAILLLGAEQYEQFKEYLRDPETGKAKASELVKFVEHASELQTKNS